MHEEERRELEQILGYHFLDPAHLDRALTHRSHRQGATELDNERLEFLGDRVLGLIASEALFSGFPQWDAGKLSKGLSRLVNASSIYSAAQRLGLGKYLRIGPGEEKTGGREKKRLLADAYEAVTGAIYQDAGLSAASSFLLRTLILPALSGEAAGNLDRADHKSALQEWLQQRGLGTAIYHVSASSGPEHRKQFTVHVSHQGRSLAESEGSSKKEAEQSAAKLALEVLIAGCEKPA